MLATINNAVPRRLLASMWRAAPSAVLAASGTCNVAARTWLEAEAAGARLGLTGVSLGPLLGAFELTMALVLALPAARGWATACLCMTCSLLGLCALWDPLWAGVLPSTFAALGSMPTAVRFTPLFVALAGLTTSAHAAQRRTRHLAVLFLLSLCGCAGLDNRSAILLVEGASGIEELPCQLLGTRPGWGHGIDQLVFRVQRAGVVASGLPASLSGAPLVTSDRRAFVGVYAERLGSGATDVFGALPATDVLSLFPGWGHADPCRAGPCGLGAGKSIDVLWAWGDARFGAPGNVTACDDASALLFCDFSVVVPSPPRPPHALALSPVLEVVPAFFSFKRVCAAGEIVGSVGDPTHLGSRRATLGEAPPALHVDVRVRVGGSDILRRHAWIVKQAATDESLVSVVLLTLLKNSPVMTAVSARVTVTIREAMQRFEVSEPEPPRTMNAVRQRVAAVAASNGGEDEMLLVIELP